VFDFQSGVQSRKDRARQRRGRSKQGGDVMDRQSSGASAVEALAIVGLVSGAATAAVFALQHGFPGLLELCSRVQLTAFLS
jgi:hypothetical protein